MTHTKSILLGLTALVPLLSAVWTPQTSGVTALFRGVSAASATVAWVSGSGSTVLRTADGGETWTKLTVTSDRIDFRDIDAINERVAYVLSIGNGPASRIYKTIDAGATWTLQYTADDQKIFLDAMAFWDEQNGIVVGDSFDGQFLMMTTSDGGAHWTRIPPASLPPALENEGAFAASGTNITVLGGNDAWFGTGASTKARVLHTADRGKTWTIADTTMIAGPSAGIYSVAFRDRMHGVAVGGDYAKEAEAIDNLVVTSDGGKTWTLVKDKALSGFRSVVAYVPGASTPTVVAVGPQGSDISIDDGRTWTPIAGRGYHTFSFAPGQPIGWGAGGRGTIGLLAVK